MKEKSESQGKRVQEISLHFMVQIIIEKVIYNSSIKRLGVRLGVTAIDLFSCLEVTNTQHRSLVLNVVSETSQKNVCDGGNQLTP